MAEEKSNQNNVPKKQEQDDNKTTVRYTLLGGAVGAGVGLLASPEVFTRISKSEVTRAAGREIRRTAQDFITEQAMAALRQNTSSYFSKYTENLIGRANGSPDETEETEGSAAKFQEQYDELKDENKNLNEKLQGIEEKLDALLKAAENSK
ncbi:GvpT/GvpP family gas vesicle accessory protein [Lentibacillus sediminis]|uniref:GvpT/GvpP family gas vesicle accessory protein n=1 Tax=Lentibacillus sediminis TaxID=1940529 RepID=UPI000C1B8AF6|nr:GvpT/GvpP family gas vesicle accessory protein [Lentibacillus sediminis]